MPITQKNLPILSKEEDGASLNASWEPLKGRTTFRWPSQRRQKKNLSVGRRKDVVVHIEGDTEGSGEFLIRGAEEGGEVLFFTGKKEEGLGCASMHKDKNPPPLIINRGGKKRGSCLF